MIKSIELENFRKFETLSINTESKIVILTGPNAIGKTSVLESIYLISTSKSHRTNDIEDVIEENKNYSIIKINSNKRFKLVLSNEGRKSFINDKEYSKLSEFIGNLNVLMFSPSDIELITGQKGTRRRFLDIEISLLDKMYLKEITAYRKLLKERNEILKIYKEENKLMLDVITGQLIEMIDLISNKRIKFIEQINSILKNVSKKLECENINLNYLPTYDLNNIKKSFDNKLAYDLISKTTNIGLHRDDFEIYINDKSIQTFGSEGQMRNTILAIKLAIMEIYKKENKDIILLLDDVFASIDQKRINKIMEYIKLEKQTFITTTSLFNIPDELLKEAKIIKL